MPAFSSWTRGDRAGSRTKEFHSGQASDSASRPQLLVAYGGSSSATSGSEIALAAGSATKRAGKWVLASTSSAVSGTVIRHPNAGAAKIKTALSSPSNYFELTFTAQAGVAYRLWIHGKADGDDWANDSVHVQFSGSTTKSGSKVYRIGTTSSTVVNLEDCNDCGLSGWKWQDNGWGGRGVLGPAIYFATTGTQTMRVQTREDGLSIDQILLSPSKYLSSEPPATNQSTTSPEPAAPTPAPTTDPAPSGSKTLRVLEWNLHHGVGTDGKYDLNRIATWMAKMNPQVVILNEVEKNTGWGNEDQPARYKALLQQKTGRTWYAHFYQEFGDWSSSGKGHVILSIYPLESTGHTTLTPSSGLKGAGAVGEARITVNGRTITLVVSHLDPDSQSMRLTQAKETIAWASSFPENRILAGDMNAWPDQSSIAAYNKTYADSWAVAESKGTAYAFSGLSPSGATKKGRIDYIFYSKGAGDLSVRSSQVYDTRDSKGIMPSDHRPVVTTFVVR